MRKAVPMQRYIGIRHRVKKTAENEARPTQLAVSEGGEIRTIELPTETDELDFVLGRFPTKMRKVTESEDLTQFASHQITWKELKKGEDLDQYSQNLIRIRKNDKGDKVTLLATKVPCEFDGLTSGDTIVMLLGGSGDNFAFALSRRGEEIGARVLRIPPFRFKEWRDATKDNDAKTLAELAQAAPELFYGTDPRDRNLIKIREAYRARIDAMKARIACEQRLRQHLIGTLFCNNEGKFPEGDIEKMYDAAKASDAILQAMITEENRRKKEIEVALDQYDVFHELFEPIQGCGPSVASRFISSVVDIRRFWKEPDKATMEALYAQSRQLEREGRFLEDLDKIAERITPETNAYQRLQMVRSWKRAHGQEAEAALLDQAIAIHQKRKNLRRQAEEKGAAALKAFCGVHVLPNGTFPRLRNGVVANWNGEARQALYLIGEQFNRRPGSVWGQKLLLNKKKLRAAHPDVVCKQCGCKWDECQSQKAHKRAYNDGHIHKMAIWRTLSQFVEWLFREWTRLERQHRGLKRPTTLTPTEPTAPAADDNSPAASQSSSQAQAAA